MAWIFVAGQIAFAESFPDRPTAAEMQEIVRLGTECVLGVNERCWATQYTNNPAQYRVAPFAQNYKFYLDQSLMGQMAGKIKYLLPWYVNTAAVSNRIPDIATLTVTGVWASLGIGDGISNFTLLPASDLNPTTYGDYPWRIYEENLQERYKVLQAETQTLAAVTQYWSEVWQGVGMGNTYEEARNAAEADYGPRSNGYFQVPIRQSTKAVSWSNFDYEVEHEWTNDLKTDLTVTLAKITNIVVASSNIWPLVITNILATNVIVTGDIRPDVGGTYLENSPYPDLYRRWLGSNTLFESRFEWFPGPDESWLTVTLPTDSWRHEGATPEGTYEPANGVYEGTAYAAFTNADGATNIIVTGDIWPDVTGTYVEVGGFPFRAWVGNFAGYTVELFWESESRSSIYFRFSPFCVWARFGNAPEGPHQPATNYGSIAEGTAYAAFDYVSEVITNQAAPVDYSGVYSNKGVYWESVSAERGSYYLYSNETVRAYVIYTNLDLNTNEAYLVNFSRAITGAYVAVNFVADTEVSYLPASPDPSGTYMGNCYPAHIYRRDVFQQGEWQKDSWRIFSNGGSWYITEDTSGGIPPMPSWSRSGDGPGGEYATINGDGIYGVPYVTTNTWRGCQTTSQVHRTQSWGTNTIFYQCWLTKVWCVANIYDLNAVINHRAQYWVYPRKPDYGTINLYSDQGLGLDEKVWNVLEWWGWAGGTWSDWTFMFPGDWWATANGFGEENLAEPPEDIPNPSYLRNHPNESVCIGFTVTNNFKAIVDWQFRYCIGE